MRACCWLGAILALVPALWAAAPPPAGAPAWRKAQLARRALLARQTVQLWNAGQPEPALERWVQKLGIDRAVFGPDHDEVFRSLHRLAWLNEQAGRWPAARAALVEARAATQRRHGRKGWRSADADRALADLDRRARLRPAQRQRLAEAVALNGRVVQLWRQGRSREALPLARQVLATRRELLGQKHPETALALFNLAAQHFRLGEYKEAESRYKEALAVRRAALGEDHPDTAHSLVGLGHVYRALDDPGQARDLFERAWTTFRATLGDDHPDVAVAVGALAGAYRKLGEYARARPLYEDAVRRDVRAGRTRTADHASNLNNLALLYQDLGEYARARELMERALDLRRRVLGEDHPHFAISLNDLALLEVQLGLFDRARQRYQSALRVLEDRLGKGSPFYQTTLLNLGSLYTEMGDHRRARPVLERGVKLAREHFGQTSFQYTTAVNHLADFHTAVGDDRRARELAEEALELARKRLPSRHPTLAVALHNAAHACLAAGDLETARARHEEALKLACAVWGERHRQLVSHLSLGAALYHQSGKLDEARAAYRAALALVPARQPLARAALLTRLADLDLQQGRAEVARRLAEQAYRLQASWLGARHFDQVMTWDRLAWAYQGLGDQHRARALLERALEVVREHLDNTFAVLSERQRVSLLSQHRGLLDHYLSLAPAVRPGRLYAEVLRWKSAVAARSRAEVLGRDEPKLQALSSDLRLARAGLARLAVSAPASKAERADWLRRFKEFEDRKEKAEIELAFRSAEFRRERVRDQTGAAEVSASLPPGAALIDWLVYVRPRRLKGQGKVLHEHRLLGFVLVQGRAPVLVEVGPLGPIRQAIQAWRGAVVGGTDPAQPGVELLRRLWLPVARHLDGARVVLIAPDGPLAGLPFGALPGKRRGSYLLEEITLGHVSSGRDLLHQDSGVAGAASLLAVGGLDYGKAPGTAPAPAWGALPGTRTEVEAVAAVYRQAFPRGPEPRLLGGREADAGRLLRQLPPGGRRWRYLHLATHGWSEPAPVGSGSGFGQDRALLTYHRNPLLSSGLVLSGANADPAAGTLRAEEVAGLDLRGCELVVLSACETALGRVEPGEGVLGLRRAFRAAGAQSTIASLWPVHDAAASVLMAEFYARLWGKEKTTPLEALRQAQLFVLRNPDRVSERARQLRAELLARGAPQAELEARGLGKKAVLVADQPPRSSGRRSPPAWWAAFVLAGRGW
jgi:CHAT domain-containing protein/tetratricopeptide (TPR) repeat protein